MYGMYKGHGFLNLVSSYYNFILYNSTDIQKWHWEYIKISKKIPT